MILKEGHTVDTDTERPSGISFWVVADCFKNRWVHHPAAEYFKPAGLLADRTPIAGTENAADEYFGTWFRVRKEAGTERDLRVGIKDPLQKLD